MGNECFSEVKVQDEPKKPEIIFDFSGATTMVSNNNEITEQQQRKDLFYNESTILQMPPVQYVKHEFKSSNADDTHCKSMIGTCHQCQMYIDTVTIQLQCYHMYHEECFIEYLKNQLMHKQTILQCLCNTKIKAKTLRLLKIPEKYLERLHKLQIIELANKYKLIQCEKCKFIYYNQDNTECNCLNQAENN